MNKWWGLVLVMLVISASAQKPEEEFAYFQSVYPTANAVVVDRHEVLDVKVVGDSLVVTSSFYDETIYLGDKPSYYAKEVIFSSGFSSVRDIEAATLLPGKRKYSVLKVEEIKESYDMDSHIFFDDGRETTFHYPSLVKGSKSVLEYSRDYKDPRIIGANFFQSYKPLHKVRYTVIFDQGVEMGTHIINDKNHLITQKETVLDNGRKQIVCTATEVPKIEYQSESPSFKNLVPMVYYQIESFRKSDGTQKDVLSNLEDLHAWYQTFVEKVGKPDDQIKAIVNQLVNPDDSDLEKVRKIYNWVQKNVKYVAFEDGMRGFVPHPGSYVLDKRYGDCKDMSSIIVDMLRAAGVAAYHTWIGTRDLPYSYHDLPSPIVDNHMIATCNIDGQWYFLDATGSYTPLGFPTSMIQGKECFIDMGNSYKVLEVPVLEPSESVIYDSVYIALDDKRVVGNGYVSIGGYNKVYSNYHLIKSSQKEQGDYVNTLVNKGSNKFIVKSYDLHYLDSLEVPTTIDYTFNIDNYYKEIGDQLYINLILDQGLVDAIIENRNIPVENDYNYTVEHVVAMKIPSKMTLEHLPQDEHFDSDVFGYDITYKVKENEILVSKKIYVDYLELEPSQFEEWNSAIRKYSSACRNAVILKKQNN